MLANPELGALVSESGAGCTWAGNSRLNQLSAWSNDPLADLDGESFHVQDLRTREIWPIGRTHGRTGRPCRVEHRPGASCIRQVLVPGLGSEGRDLWEGRDGHDAQGGPEERAGRHGRGRVDRIRVSTTWCVAAHSAIKRVQIELRNEGTRDLELRVAGVVEWLMGSVRGDRRTVSTEFSRLRERAAPLDLLLATQHDAHQGQGGGTAFLGVHMAGAASAMLEDWTCDRREMFDARGRACLPDHLGQRAGAGLDPCAAATLSLRLPARSGATVVFVIGHAGSRALAQLLGLAEVMQEAAGAAAATHAHLRSLLGAVTVHTPDALFDALVNHWLPYQILACRLWARAGFYQAGGAYGFRDQLQDAMGLAVIAPQLLREQLLRAAARQFAEGDVQHWWHPPLGGGTRTRFSDDLLWLPHATLHYLRVTEDLGVLDEVLPFIEGEAVPEGAEDAYFVPRISRQAASLYEHGARCIDRSLAVGVHGLPLIGGGDWNDGMNRIGHQGRGESVWLAWFLCHLVAGFAPLARARGDRERAARWRVAARGWRRALAREAWDGEWYRRAFFDDGTPLGTRAGAECRIDLIAQAWSVLAGAAGGASLQRQRQAMASARRLLADPEHGLVRLLDPPLAAARPAAGYIQAYPPGVRENGAQYAHGAVWAAMAQAQLGDAEGAWQTWTWLSPAHRTAHPAWGAAYGLEPYVMAADVYSQPPYAGRGGWSWYTGSAAGLLRTALEFVCGLEVAGHRARLRPCLPGHWPSVTLEWRENARRHVLTLCAATATEAITAARARGATPLAEDEWLDGAEAGDGSHHLVVCASRHGAAPATAGADLFAREQTAAD